MQVQTGLTVIGPTGKQKNCRSWAEFEEPRKSVPNVPNTANLCNGGWFKGDYYEECAAKFECAQETRAKAEGRRYLPLHQPQTHQERPFGSQLLATTPNLSDMLKQDRWQPSLPASMPKSYVQQTQNGQQQRANPGQVPTPFQVPHPLPYPVQPPSDWPKAMQTPYAGPVPVMGGGGITPTFLPVQDEDPFARLIRNVANGLVGSTGWHIFDFSRSVDLFGRRR